LVTRAACSPRPAATAAIAACPPHPQRPRTWPCRLATSRVVCPRRVLMRKNSSLLTSSGCGVGKCRGGSVLASSCARVARGEHSARRTAHRRRCAGAGFHEEEAKRRQRRVPRSTKGRRGGPAASAAAVRAQPRWTEPQRSAALRTECDWLRSSVVSMTSARSCATCCCSCLLRSSEAARLSRSCRAVLCERARARRPAADAKRQHGNTAHRPPATLPAKQADARRPSWAWRVGAKAGDSNSASTRTLSRSSCC
jgi:hypothetical protein